jgi:hypothetical protein
MSEHSPNVTSADNSSRSLASRAKELAERSGDGITVRLFWDESSNDVWVDVADKKVGNEFSVPVNVNRGESAMDVFHHPFAYAGHIAVGSFQEAA